jgi:hypothetical protein
VLLEASLVMWYRLFLTYRAHSFNDPATKGPSFTKPKG